MPRVWRPMAEGLASSAAAWVLDWGVRAEGAGMGAVEGQGHSFSRHEEGLRISEQKLRAKLWFMKSLASGSR